MLSTLAILAAEEGNGAWLPSELNEVIWGTLSFLVVATLLVKFAKAPTLTFLANRTAGIKATLDEAEQERISAEAARDGVKAALADSDTEAARIIEQAHADAEQLGRDTKIRAARDAQQVTERAAADLVSNRQQAESDLAGELSRLSLGAAERVVETSLDDATQQRLIQSYIDQVGSQN
ncbi:MAG: F0F1 ATP synthase subunit B [Actinomycetes bacterium]